MTKDVDLSHRWQGRCRRGRPPHRRQAIGKSPTAPHHLPSALQLLGLNQLFLDRIPLHTPSALHFLRLHCRHRRLPQPHVGKRGAERVRRAAKLHLHDLWPDLAHDTRSHRRAPLPQPIPQRQQGREHPAAARNHQHQDQWASNRHGIHLPPGAPDKRRCVCERGARDSHA